MSIQLGMDSGRQFTNRPLGSPASSAASSFAIWAAAAGFQGGGADFMRAFWSDMLGVQTPLQSGSLASAAQSAACGGGLVSGSTAPAAAPVPTTATANPMATQNTRIECC